MIPENLIKTSFTLNDPQTHLYTLELRDIYICTDPKTELDTIH